MRFYDAPLAERMRHAELKRQRYRRNPEMRLAAINKARVREGRPTISSLEESRKLRLPLDGDAA
jgi:hypothetical protein